MIKDKTLITDRQAFIKWKRKYTTHSGKFYAECGNAYEEEPKSYPCILLETEEYNNKWDDYDIYYDFVYLQDFSELCEDDEEFSDYEPEYVAINKEDISVGDYIGIECERFGGYSSHLRIVDIQQRYDGITGEPYKIVTDEEDEIWSTQSGNCLSNPKTFYEIYGYFRELKY